VSDADQDDTDLMHRSRNAGRRMAAELCRRAMEGGRATEARVEPRVVVQAASDYLTESLASGHDPKPD
jgi:hypothetical protein